MVVLLWLSRCGGVLIMVLHAGCDDVLLHISPCFYYYLVYEFV